MESVITLITNPHPFETLQARIDFAEVAKTEIYENPWWYQHTESGKMFHGLVGCIGWPGEVTEKGEGQPGYAAVVGVLRSKNQEADPSRAKFYILNEYENHDVPLLLDHCITIREKYGFGINRDLLSNWYGDPERFATVLALKNDSLVLAGGEKNSLIIAPPDDYVLKNRFEVYLRALKGVLNPLNQRLYVGKCEVLKSRIREFKKNDPVIIAMGGLVHTLLTRTPWMGQRTTDNVFNLKEVL